VRIEFYARDKICPGREGGRGEGGMGREGSATVAQEAPTLGYSKAEKDRDKELEDRKN
jgi:hypothetical protein